MERKALKMIKGIRCCPKISDLTQNFLFTGRKFTAETGKSSRPRALFNKLTGALRQASLVMGSLDLARALAHGKKAAISGMVPFQFLLNGS